MSTHRPASLAERPVPDPAPRQAFRWPGWMRQRLPDSLPAAAGLFLIMLAAGAAIYLAALNSLLANQQNLARQTAQLRAAQADLRKLPDRMALIDQARADFQVMARRGFLAPGDRLNWLSALARVGQEMQATTADGSGLQSLTWQLEPQEAHANRPNMWVTAMTLRAAPISAVALEQLLRRLAEEAHGRFTVDNCSLALGSPAGQVECRLLWWNWRTGGGRADTTNAGAVSDEY